MNIGRYTTLVLAVCAAAVGVPSAVAAQACPTPAAMGGVTVNHAVCKPPGPGICAGDPRSPGRDMCPCSVGGLQGGSVQAMCMSGCCTRVSETGASDAFDPQMLLQMLQSLLQGGGGGGGGDESGNMPTYGYPQQAPEEQPLLEFGSTVTDDTTNVLFDDTADTTEQEEQQRDEPETSEQVSSVAPRQEGDTVSTVIEQVPGENTGEGGFRGADARIAESNGIDPLTGGDFFDDLANANLSDADILLMQETGLTLAELEAQGLLAAHRRGETQTVYTTDPLTVPYQSLTPAEIRSLQERDRSAFAVSGGFSPFHAGAHDNSANQSAGFFDRVISFFAGLFGLAPSR